MHHPVLICTLGCSRFTSHIVELPLLNEFSPLFLVFFPGTLTSAFLCIRYYSFYSPNPEVCLFAFSIMVLDPRPFHLSYPILSANHFSFCSSNISFADLTPSSCRMYLFLFLSILLTPNIFCGISFRPPFSLVILLISNSLLHQQTSFELRNRFCLLIVFFCSALHLLVLSYQLHCLNICNLILIRCCIIHFYSHLFYYYS